MNLKYFQKKNIIVSFFSKNKTQNLQKKLVGISKEDLNDIIDELKGTFRTIIKNINGNYFCSDLIKICDKKQRLTILSELSNTLTEDCIDEFGNYPIQKLIEFASDEEEFHLLIHSFNDLNKIIMPCLNKYGSFVIRKLIEQIPEKSREVFNTLFVKLTCILSRDMHGVYVLQKFICFTKNELLEKEIINTVLNNFVNISCNQYGNYFIQNLLEKWWNTKKGFHLKKMIISKYSILIENNYSSYICDLFLRLCNDKEKKLIISYINNDKILKDKENKNKSLFINKNEIHH